VVAVLGGGKGKIRGQIINPGKKVGTAELLCSPSASSPTTRKAERKERDVTRRSSTELYKGGRGRETFPIFGTGGRPPRSLKIKRKRS